MCIEKLNTRSQHIFLAPGDLLKHRQFYEFDHLSPFTIMVTSIIGLPIFDHYSHMSVPQWM